MGGRLCRSLPCLRLKYTYIHNLRHRSILICVLVCAIEEQLEKMVIKVCFNHFMEKSSKVLLYLSSKVFIDLSICKWYKQVSRLSCDFCCQSKIFSSYFNKIIKGFEQEGGFGLKSIYNVDQF